MTLQDTDRMLLPAVRRTVAELEQVRECDLAAVRLAEHYAALIDNHRDPAWALRWIGPLLLDTLQSLGATPAARNAFKNGKDLGKQPASRLAALRAAHTA